MPIPLDQQIAEVKREIALRENVYPSFVARGKMRQGEADLHLERMQAVLTTLLWLKENENVIRVALKHSVQDMVTGKAPSEAKAIADIALAQP